MNPADQLFVNIGGRLLDFKVPKIMGILNVTSESFYAKSRSQTKEQIKKRICEIIEEGADIIDIGGCSTRPGADIINVEEEYSRLQTVLEILKNISPEFPVSIDTFRASIARRCISEWNVSIINDVSGGNLDPMMWETIAEFQAVYVLTHMRGTPATMNSCVDYEDVTADVIKELSWKVKDLHKLGVKDIIIDPGFGFAKTTGQNFQLLAELTEFCRMGMPVLVGISRKSMIWKTLGIRPEDSLNETLSLEAIAIDKGANILRVHDVKETVNLVKLMIELKKNP